MAEVLFFSRIGCRPWAALLNSSSPPNRYPPNARRSYAYCLGALVEDLGAGTALADVTPERLRRGTTVWPRWDRSAAGYRLRVGLAA